MAATRALLIQHAPHEFYLRGEQILKNKAAMLAAMRLQTTEPDWQLTDFCKPPLTLSIPKSILLPGGAGIGKTCFAAAHGKQPYVIKTLDQLKNIPADCDLLVFDDMRFDKDGLDLTPEEMIALLDVKRETAVKCRHYDGLIPCLPRIFTTNLDCSGVQHPFVPGASRAQQNAIRRRFRQVPWQDQWMFSLPKIKEEDEEETAVGEPLW